MDTNYGDSVSQLRETTKWLVAFVPVTSLVGTVILVDRTTSTEGVGTNLIVPLALIGLGLVVLITTATRVLTTPPASYIAIVSRASGDTLDKRSGDVLTAAFTEGVMHPYYPTAQAFAEATLDHWANPRLPNEKLAAAKQALLEYSLFRDTTRRFRAFLVAGLIGLACIATGAIATAQLGPAPDPTVAIEEPLVLVGDLSTAGAEALQRTTSCEPDKGTMTFTAIGGTYGRPLLRVDGPGCRLNASWRPGPSDIEFRLP